MKTIRETQSFRRWLNGLRDRKTTDRIMRRIGYLERGLYGDCKAVGAGVSELRLDFGPGYRIYFTERNEETIILLAAGDKSGQQRDIERAIELASQL